MNSFHDLDDPSKTVVYLPAREEIEDDEHNEQDAFSYPDYQPYASRDIPGGYELRLKVYQQAWTRCLERVQAIVRQLNTPVVESVVEHIQLAYSESRILPTLPYPELPVVALSSSGGKSAVISDVLETLENDIHPQTNGKGKGKAVNGRATTSTTRTEETSPKTIVTHVRPAECPNLMSTMKTIITGFVERRAEEEDEISDEEDLLPRDPRRKATTSLANYDINLLAAWYTALKETADRPTQLLVVFHEFEKFNAAMMQDVFYICSQQIPRLPLVFLLELASPASPSYMHSAFTRSTLALLRLHTVVAPSGPDVVKEIITKTLFDVNFTPDVMLGPATLEYLIDFTTRHTSSVDALLSILQLAYLKHFDEPLSIFAQGIQEGTAWYTDLLSRLSEPESFNFLDSLLTRIWQATQEEGSDTDKLGLPEINWRQPDPAELLKVVSIAHAASRKRAQRMKFGANVLRIVQTFMRSHGYKSSHSGTDESESEMFARIVRGRASKDAKYLGMAVKKLSAKQLKELLSSLYQFFASNSSLLLRHNEEDPRVRLMGHMNSVPNEAIQQDDEGGDPEFRVVHPAVPPIASSVGEWLTEYIESRLVRLDQGLLWDIWNTGLTPFPSELINPAPRPIIVNALLHPHNVVESYQALYEDEQGHATEQDPFSTELEEKASRPIWELPDTSILFRRYIEAGKKINVYDWYESFVLVLETQQRELRKRARSQSKSPRKGKGKAKAKDTVSDDDDGELTFENEEEEEKWRVEVQARFIRSLHELDFMGFLKHTNRKVDHVVKTIYDIPD
ncbi:hypothetical protein K474DRAFT_1769394 [Panus rudis PR-1116 ss-1]|nr:hypothetical protein K474DRAFT_1769394 [Panus rudis PR-1116 ss-1]